MQVMFTLIADICWQITGEKMAQTGTNYIYILFNIVDLFITSSYVAIDNKWDLDLEFKGNTLPYCGIIYTRRILILLS